MADKTDISDKVFLTPIAVAAWGEVAQKAVQALGRRIKPEEIGEEVIALNSDGKTLTVSCTIGNGEVTMIVPVGQWRWNTGSAN